MVLWDVFYCTTISIKLIFTLNLHVITQQHGTNRTGHMIQNDTQTVTYTHEQEARSGHNSAKIKIKCDHYELSELIIKVLSV